MKLSIISTTLALTASAFAAPTHPKAQLQIQNLQQQITTVSNDLIQSSSSLKADWNTGATLFGSLSNKLAGPQPCSIFTPQPPKTKNQALKALQSTQTFLQQLSSDLLDPSKSIRNSDFHADVCQAQEYYSSTSKFVGV